MAKKAPKTLIGKFLAVLWEDAWQSMEYFTREEAQDIPPMHILSLGCCIRDDDAAVTLAMDMLPDGRFRTTKTIPRGMVREVKVIQ